MAERNAGGGRIFVNGEELAETIDRVSGGGPKTHPQTFEEARDRLVPQLQELSTQMSEMPSELRANRVIIEAEMWANYLAVSYFPRSLVQFLGAHPLGSRVVPDGTYSLPSTGPSQSVTKSYLLAVDENAVDNLVGLLAGRVQQGVSSKTREQIAQFTKIGVAAPHIRDDVAEEAEDLASFEAVLHPDPDASTSGERREASEGTLAKFANLVHSVGGRVHDDWNDVVDGLTFTSIEIPPSAASKVAAFNPLRSLSPTPQLHLPLTRDGGEAEGVVSGADEQAAATLPQVLIFDGGVDTTDGVFSSHVEHINLAGNDPTNKSLQHGEAVTGAVLFGQLAPGEPLPPAAATVKHYQVVPGGDSDPEFPRLLRQIRDVVEQEQPALVNLSLGPRIPIEDHEPHRWTAVLDKLAHKHGTLFITAAGNDGEKDRTAGLHRVQVPGDMVNGLCVGAFVPSTNGWGVAAYSGRGPGRAGARIQPAVVAFGGHEVTPRFARLRSDGSLFLDGHGTSYAAPLVTNLAAKLTTELGPRADAPTIRALLAHSAERSDDHDVLDVGFGRVPSDVSSIVESPADEVKLIYRGLISRDEVRSFQLPHPQGAVLGKYELKWTLAFTTGTDSAEAGDYTSAGLETTFRPHSTKYKLTKGKQTKVLDIAAQSAEAARLIAAGWRVPSRPESFSAPSEYASEAALRDHGKWESISQWQCVKVGSSLHEPAIDISYVTRENGKLSDDTPDIEFSLVVSIKSRSGHAIYAMAQNEFSVITPLPVPVPIDATVESEVNIESW